MKIYTRTGDQGKTSLFTGQRISKHNPFIDALGSVDEANCAIGIAIACLPKRSLIKIKEQLEIIQHALFDVGAAIATPRSKATEKKLKKTRFDEEAITLLEQWIDEMDAKLPKLHAFILPGGHPVGAHLHLARSIVRRAERASISLYESGDLVQDVLVFLNRLSDYLFVVSRFVNHKLKISETQWKPHQTSSLEE